MARIYTDLFGRITDQTNGTDFHGSLLGESQIRRMARIYTDLFGESRIRRMTRIYTDLFGESRIYTDLFGNHGLDG
jgi:hypothetical protein